MHSSSVSPSQTLYINALTLLYTIESVIYCRGQIVYCTISFNSNGGVTRCALVRILEFKQMDGAALRQKKFEQGDEPGLAGVFELRASTGTFADKYITSPVLRTAETKISRSRSQIE